MSIDLITMARRRLDVSHGELLVAVEICDAANEEGEGIFIGVERIADRSRQDVRTVQRQLKRLVQVRWLLVVRRGGGRRFVNGHLVGVPTTYRINPAWIKGDTLPGFEDYKPKFYNRDNGDNLTPLEGENGDTVESPLEGGERCQKPPGTVTKTPGNGDTAVSPDPLTRIPKDARARATPSGSRAAPKKKPSLPPGPAPFDEGLTRGYWWNHAVSFTLSTAAVFELCPYGARKLDDLPLYRREILKPVLAELVDWAVREERANYPLSQPARAAMHVDIESRLNREIKVLRPAPPAERAALNVEAPA